MSYDYIHEAVSKSGANLPLCATNDKGENVVISGGKDMYHLMTFQSNGWCRENEYYPDGTITETFSR